MPECPKCSGILRIKGTHWVCSNNPYCNYQREAVKPVPSQDKLLIKVRELEKLVAKLTSERDGWKATAEVLGNTELSKRLLEKHDPSRYTDLTAQD